MPIDCQALLLNAENVQENKAQFFFSRTKWFNVKDKEVDDFNLVQKKTKKAINHSILTIQTRDI